jgi:dUTP pyrophosphatase
MTKLTQNALSYLQRELKRAQVALEGDCCSENAARLHEVDTISYVISSVLQEKPVFTVEKMTETAKLPVKAHPTDAGWDIFSDESVVLVPNRTAKVKTGIKISSPENWEIQVRSRGSMASKSVIVSNSPGTIDSGYRGEICVLLLNLANYRIEISKGDKIAQLIFAPVYDISLEEGVVNQDSDRNSNGFGSTGK